MTYENIDIDTDMAMINGCQKNLALNIIFHWLINLQINLDDKKEQDSIFTEYFTYLSKSWTWIKIFLSCTFCWQLNLPLRAVRFMPISFNEYLMRSTPAAKLLIIIAKVQSLPTFGMATQKVISIWASDVMT